MQKPPTEDLRQVTADFCDKYLSNAPEDMRGRISYQMFRMFDDLPVEDWEKQSEVPLEDVCALFAEQILNFFVTCKQLRTAMRYVGMEPPEDWGKLPNERFPDENFYEIIENDTKTLQERQEKRQDGPQEEGISLDSFDFSGGFSA